MLSSGGVVALDNGVQVVPPPSLVMLWQHASAGFRERLYHPDTPAQRHLSLTLALQALAQAAQPAPAGLVPITFVDDRSLACVVCCPQDGPAPEVEGAVVRWHLDPIPVDQQGRLLDTDAWLYAESVVVEERARDRGFAGMTREAAIFEKNFTAKDERPKAKHLRPFQLACQNVVVGLAAMRHEPALNAHVVRHWLACEVPHVGTNEAARALCVLMLCDAFQAGGTMEINFEEHPERQIPAALHRYARTLGIELGREFNGGRSISPEEARQLFLRVTPMPDELRQRVKHIIDRGVVSAESLCYCLLSPIWRPIELDFILGCSARAASILTGGSALEDRLARSAEFEICRAAVMAGMLLRRLDSKDAAGADAAERRVFDDVTNGVTWSVLPDYGAVWFRDVPPGNLPWQPDSANPIAAGPGGDVVVVLRPHPLPEDVEVVDRLRQIYGDAMPVVTAVPADIELAGMSRQLTVLRCPDRVNDLNAAVIRNQRASKLART